MGLLKTARLYVKVALKMALSSSIPTQVTAPRAVKIFDTPARPAPEPDRRKALLDFLRMGKPGEAYLTEMRCPRCGFGSLGRRDMTLGWFMWPENAQHLVIDHQVWTEGCDKLVDWMIEDVMRRYPVPPRRTP